MAAGDLPAPVRTADEWAAYEAFVADDAYRRYEAGELDLNEAFQLVQAARDARRAVDPEYERDCLEKEADILKRKRVRPRQRLRRC